ncbi:MAG: DJ-1/PfpI family protein [Candidatus Omnitrophota bacterium]
MAKKVLVCATNFGVWAEELQGPWDELKKAGFDVTLATPQGKKPLPLKISVDPDFVDPMLKKLPGLNPKVNPKFVCDRTKALVEGNEWSHPIKLADAKMSDYDAIVGTGGLGAMMDLAPNKYFRGLIYEAYYSNKLIATLCYATAALIWVRDPKDAFHSIIKGKRVVCHPRAWDFEDNVTLELWGATEDNKGTDAVYAGFLYPLEDIARDAVGQGGRCIGDPQASRDNPRVEFDWPFITGNSVESSIAFGKKIVEVLNTKSA